MTIKIKVCKLDISWVEIENFTQRYRHENIKKQKIPKTIKTVKSNFLIDLPLTIFEMEVSKFCFYKLCTNKIANARLHVKREGHNLNLPDYFKLNGFVLTRSYVYYKCKDKDEAVMIRLHM